MNPRWFCLQGTRVQFLVQVLKESSPLCQEQTVDVSVLGSLCSSSSSLIVIPVTNVNFANPPRTLIPLYLRRPHCCRRSSSVVDVCCPWQSMPAIRFPFCGISSIIPSYWPHPRPVFRHHGLEDPSKTSSQALRRFPCLCRCFVTMGLETPTKLHPSLPSQPVTSYRRSPLSCTVNIRLLPSLPPIACCCLCLRHSPPSLHRLANSAPSDLLHRIVQSVSVRGCCPAPGVAFKLHRSSLESIEK